MTAVPATDLRDITRADVYVGDTVVATLTRTPRDDIAFAYIDDACPSAGRAGSVSWSLPPDGDYPLITTGAAVPPFFAGLLPEGVRLGAVAASTKSSFDDHLTLLLAVSSDTIGDVRVVPGDTIPRTGSPMFSPDRDVDFRQLFTRLAGAVEEDPVALSGVQPKVSAAMWSAPTMTRRGPATLKLTPPTGFPKLSENEHFFMRMAAACGIRVPATRLINDADGRSGLLVARFDRAAATRIPQEDACQVAGLYPASKYRMKAESAIATLADACARGGGSSRAATLELLRVTAFSWLIGNGDLHGKNLSVHAPDGLWQPTPAYDLLTTQPYTGWKDPMALPLYGRANRLTRTHFVEAGIRLGLRERAVTRMLDAMIDAAQPWIGRCGEIGFSDRDSERLEQLLDVRIASLG